MKVNLTFYHNKQQQLTVKIHKNALEICLQIILKSLQKWKFKKKIENMNVLLGERVCVGASSVLQSFVPDLILVFNNLQRDE